MKKYPDNPSKILQQENSGMILENFGEHLVFRFSKIVTNGRNGYGGRGRRFFDEIYSYVAFGAPKITQISNYHLFFR
jgi:hypothetical protein